LTFAFVAESCSDLPVAAACRVMKMRTSGFYGWQTAQHAPCERTVQDRALTAKIIEVHRQSRGTYGSPRVHAELRLGEGLRIGRKRVERLMRQVGLEGVYRRRRRGCTTRNPAAEPADDLVNRRFTVHAPDRLWVSDITEHPTAGGLYLAVVIDAWSRPVVGWSIADHLRSELVVDALQMAIWRRQPPERTVVHSDHGTQYTSWAFGRRTRAAGLLGSMGTVGDAFDNAIAESFFGTLTATNGNHASSSRRRSSNGSNAPTTPSAATRLWGCSVPSTTRPPTRHDHHPTHPVRETGEGQTTQLIRLQSAFREPPAHHISHPLADVDCVIADPFVEPADECKFHSDTQVDHPGCMGTKDCLNEVDLQ
jgi:putative transposase